jgi:hypothetical protein
MEEKKLGKTVKMNTAKKENTEEPKKLTYEQLDQICSQLYQENQKLINQLRQQETAIMFKRLDYLFMAIQAEKVIKDPEFIASCVDEIKSALMVKNSEGEEG